MTDTTYQIVVTGVLAAGAQLAQVKENVAKLFNAPAAKLEPLFSGQRVVVKKGLDQAAAQRYVAALQAAGLMSTAETLGGTASAPAAPGAATQSSAQAPAAPGRGPELAPVGVTIIEASPTPPPDIDISAYNMSPAGTELIERKITPAPDIDISALSASPAGADMVNAEAVPAPDIDISALSMSSPGVQLVEAPAVPPAAIDTSALDLAPPGSDVGQQKPQDAPPPPDTSHLKLE